MSTVVQEIKAGTKPRLVSIDALRGLAALAVVFFHAREVNWVGVSQLWKEHHLSFNWNAWLGYLTAPAYLGGTAVTLFFVLSGYCIHRPHAGRLMKDAAYSIPLSSYFIRRAWRIYPVLIGALILTYFLDLYTLNHFPDDGKVHGLPDVSNAWKILLALQGTFADQFGSNGPLWTLAVEIQLYAVYPIAFWMTKKRGAWSTFAALTVISLAWIALAAWRKWEYVFFLPYWSTWLAGFMLAEMEVGRIAKPTPSQVRLALLFFIPALVCSFKHWYLIQCPLLSVGFGAVIWWSIGTSGERFWSRPTLLWLSTVGVFSYSLYAIHDPLLVFFRSFFAAGERSVSTLVPIGLTVLCVAVAWVYYQAIERWSLKPWFLKKPGQG